MIKLKKPSKIKKDKVNNAVPLKLLDCPHCGATQNSLDKGNGKGIYAYHDAPSSDIQTWIHVACLECGSGSPSIETWNLRLKA